jgi:hypothetical protein
VGALLRGMFELVLRDSGVIKSSREGTTGKQNKGECHRPAS